jgi:hypothetical protein
MTIERDSYDYESQLLEAYAEDLDDTLAEQDDALSGYMYCWKEDLAALFGRDVDFNNSLMVKELAVELEWSSHELADSLSTFFKSALETPMVGESEHHTGVIAMVMKKIREINQTFVDIMWDEASAQDKSEFLFDEVEILEMLQKGLENVSLYLFPERLQQKANYVINRMCLEAFRQALGD